MMKQIRATVREVRDTNLLVYDWCSKQDILVHTPKALCYCYGDRLCIQYSGVMTMSIPPQITATRIRRLRPHGC